MLNVQEIVEAWITKINPTEEQKKLAEERATICSTCDLAKGPVCSKCGCLLPAKVYSPRENPCPKRKWTCDTEYFSKKVSKTKVI